MTQATAELFQNCFANNSWAWLSVTFVVSGPDAVTEAVIKPNEQLDFG
jgi:hypothetical protein